ncbi:TIGR02530 family flagellar biosynthesis protein [Piscibacillus sp. B03]|uniref:TIGR02530 family flagellar biosynthesis protein n=1 Tax=Piscibacillus sp. B03 TaxID=3457430 RepID=UPI003FCCEF07
MSQKINPLHHQTLPLAPTPKNKPSTSSNQISFKDVLKQTSDQPVNVSKHAQKRLDERNIHISNQQWNLIGEKMKEAQGKGVTDSAVILKDTVLIASTKNNTIITAMDRNQADVVTNINGTILIED